MLKSEMLNLKCWDPVSSEKMCWSQGSLTDVIVSAQVQIKVCGISFLFLCLYEFPFSQPCIRGLEKLTQSAGKDHSLGAVGIPDKVQWNSHWCHCAHLLPGKHTARSLHWFLATGTCNRSVMDSASLITKNWVYLVQVLCQIFTKDRKRYVVLSVSIQAPKFIAVAKEKKNIQVHRYNKF